MYKNLNKISKDVHRLLILEFHTLLHRLDVIEA